MTTTIAPNQMAHSYSRLQVFTQCPLSYKLQYMDKVPAESSDAMEIGAAAHEFFDGFVKGNRFFDSTERETFDSYVLALSAACFQKESRDQANFREYLEICKTFANAYRPDPAYPRISTELSVAFNRKWKSCEWNDPSVMFRAKIDRVEAPQDGYKKIRITDYKTGYAGALDSFQLDVYALLASLLFPGVEQVEIQFYYVKSGFKQVKLLEVKDLDITKVQIEALIERIESETKWKAKPGQRCLNCSVAAHCTLKASNLEAISTPAIAEQLGEEIALLQGQLKAKNKVLKAYCQKNGGVEAGGLRYDNYPTESMVIQMGPFLSACVSYSVDPGDLLNPDSRAIKKACKTTPGFSEAISPYIGVDVSMTFRGKKSNGDE